MTERWIKIVGLAAGLPLLFMLTQTACQSNSASSATSTPLVCQPGQIGQLVNGVCTCVTNQNGLTSNCS